MSAPQAKQSTSRNSLLTFIWNRRRAKALWTGHNQIVGVHPRNPERRQMAFPNVVDFPLQKNVSSMQRAGRQRNRLMRRSSILKAWLKACSISSGVPWTRGGVARYPNAPSSADQATKTDLIRCVIADCEDEIKRGRIRLREFITGLAPEVLSAQTRVLDLAESLWPHRTGRVTSGTVGGEGRHPFPVHDCFRHRDDIKARVAGLIQAEGLEKESA